MGGGPKVAATRGERDEREDGTDLRVQHDHWPLCPQLASEAGSLQTTRRNATYGEFEVLDPSSRRD
jgi:hypothetical protein